MRVARGIGDGQITVTLDAEKRDLGPKRFIIECYPDASSTD